MKKNICKIAALLLAVSLLAGCAPQADGPDSSPALESSPTESLEPAEVSPDDSQTGEPSAGSEDSRSPAETAAGVEDAADPNTTSDPDHSQAPGASSSGSESGQSTTAPSAGQQASSAPSTAGNVPASSSSGSGGQGGTTATSSGGLQVRGTKLTDSRGNPVQLRGISTHGLAWYPDYVNEACFKQLKQEWGVNVIRLAMYTAEYGGYCTGGNQTALKNLIRKGVRYATNQGMYVIIDWHILSDGDPNTHLTEAKAFFKEMSAEFASYNNVLYEICNEPNGGVSWSRIKSYAEQVIPVIRANDKDAVIIVGTPNWSQYVDQAAADPITGYDNIMYALHFYAATHTGDLRNRMVSAIKEGLPIFVTEYGICDASGSGAINETQANLWVQTMNQYGVSYVAWNLSNKNETSALLNASCSKTSGFGASDLSASGKWLYKTLTGKAAGSGATSTPAPQASTPVVSSAPAPTSAPAQTPAPTPTPAPAQTVLTGNGLRLAVTLVNSWEENGKTVRQYSMTVTNVSGQACTAWAADLRFDGAITLYNSWNGDYTVNGSTLHITSKDYNGALAAGGSTGDVGFIVAGGAVING